MSRLHLLILWILASGAAYFLFINKKDPNTSTSATKLETGSLVFPSNLVDTIDEFKIEKGEDSVTLKKTDDTWHVVEQGNFPANFDTVTSALSEIRNAKIAQGVNASEAYYNRFDLDPTVENLTARPDIITLMSEGEDDRQLFLGKSRQATGGAGTTAGRFIRLSDDDSGVYIIHQPFAYVDADPKNWIDKDFSPLEEGVIKIEVSAPKDDSFTPWEISRNTVMDDFLLANLSEKEETENRVTGTLKNILARGSFLNLLDEEEVKARSDEKGTRLIKATDSAGSTFLITIVPEKQEAKNIDVENPSAPIPAPDPQINYIASLQILNGPTKPETPAADADTQAKAVFEQRIANLADLSASVNRLRERLEGRHFLVSQSTVGALISSRSAFTKVKIVPQTKTGTSTPPIQVPLPHTTPTPNLRTQIPTQGVPPSLARPKEEVKEVKKVKEEIKEKTKEKAKPPVEAPTTPPKRVRSIDKKAQAAAKKAAKNAAKNADSVKDAVNPPPLPGSRPPLPAEAVKVEAAEAEAATEKTAKAKAAKARNAAKRAKKAAEAAAKKAAKKAAEAVEDLKTEKQPAEAPESE